MSDSTESHDLSITRLGECRVKSPLKNVHFMPWNQNVLVEVDSEKVVEQIKSYGHAPAFQAAGPRRSIYFEPDHTRAAIVTCGGLCPGLNDVIRALVLTLDFGYGVKKVYGMRYGYEGLNPALGHKPVELTPGTIDHIHESGGTILGTSRGSQDVSVMLDYLHKMRINLLFAVGGDGTLRGAHSLARMALERGMKLSVVGVPKTIDNDIQCLQRSFGFATAASEACRVLQCAHAEARGARNGVGLVKLMGRESGFIAAYATLASGQANCCLIPEVPFTVDALNRWLVKRLKTRGHAVIVVAEGAGQDLITAAGTDASGNRRLADIGVYLRDQIQSYCAARHVPLTLKYFDPSYLIRSLPASAPDSTFCLLLAQNAAHAAMAGCTDLMVGVWNGHFTHVPLSSAISRRRTLDIGGAEWSSVLLSTGQPARLL